MIPNLTFLLLFALLRFVTTSIDYEEIQIEDQYETRSRILMVDGNVWLHAGKDKNITFKTFGKGKIYVEDTDVSSLPDTVSCSQFNQNTDIQATFNTLVGRMDNANQMLVALKSKQDTQTSAMRVVLGSAKHYLVALRNLSLEVSSLKKWKTDKMARDTRRRGLLVKMTRQIIKINKYLSMNACDSGKCQNGGTCIPRVGIKFFCLCPPHFTGEQCEADVDECSVYNGTTAGCQNNGTCVNKRGGFECICQPGHHGPLCQYHMSACSKTYELCGPHGHCIENIVDPTAETATDYKCICDWGFKVSSDKNNPTCVDVDECESNPCHPGVDCINLPGSFVCSGCPNGYKADGNACVDVNECESEVPQCSSVSKCHNTVGSYYCDACPADYSGDGYTCTKIDACAKNKCHELATCKETDDSYRTDGGYSCYCPDGYVGDGIGENGCTKTESSVCREHDCVNGATCRPTNATYYQCDCEPGYLGRYCEKTSPCHDNPCQNDGVCIPSLGKAFCQCKSPFFGDVCEFEEEHCGAHFTNSTGSYDFEMSPSNVSSICDFSFNIPAANSAVRINFTAFDKFTQEDEGPTDCATTVSNLTLYDGQNDNAPIFATFCGDLHSVHAPLGNTPITMTASVAMMRFRGTQGKFSIAWETMERKCGFRTRKPEGVLSVPQNKQDVVCEWFITAPADKVIQVTIPAIAMHSKDTENCDQNSLEIFDGYSTFDRHRILETCSSTEEAQVVTSTGPFLSVSFISNMLPGVSGLETIRGFSLNYKFITPDRQCGKEIVNVNSEFDFSGSIESPNYGSLYPANMDCTWMINGTLGNNSYSGDMVIKLTFDQFDVPSSFSSSGLAMHYRSFRRMHPLSGSIGIAPGLSRIYGYRSIMDMGTCSNDYLKIHDGDGTIVYEGCNPRKPPSELTVNNPAAVLSFHSDDSDQGKGFKIRYEMLCQKKVSGNGTIQTWNFPNGGPEGTCTYIIEAPRTHVIHVRFMTIGLRVLPMSECFYSPKPLEEYQDYVEFSGGRSDNTIFNKRYVCPKFPFIEGNWLAVSAVRPLKITVASSGNPLFKGLSLEYKTSDVGCGGMFSSMTGSITSPNYPDKYLPHMHCVYNVFVSWSKIVKLSFDTFDLETTPAHGCQYDRVEVYTTYHNETIHGKLLGKFCGSLLPPSIFSMTNTMAIVFVSDRSVSGQGFNAKFEAVNRATNCDFTFTEPTGHLEFSPLMQRYEKCVFHIAVHENQRVLISMNNMTLPCDKSSLAFRNGPTETSPPFSSLPSDSEVCTPKVNYMPVIRSFGNRVTIIYKATDSRSSYFNLTYETIANGCGGRVDGISGVVSAPQYPLGDKKNMKCDWTVAVALGNKVRFVLTALDDLNASDSNGFCPVFSVNRLDFYNSPRQGNLHLKRYCAKEMASEPITSDDNELIIKYAQSGGTQMKKIFGFSGHFTTLCTGIVHRAISGNIQSPGYPHKVYGNQYCSWTIIVPKGNRIRVSMHHFSLGYSGYQRDNECTGGNMLKVEDTDLAEAEVTFRTQFNTTNSVNKFCDKAVPRTIRSKHNTMKLTYNSFSMPTNQFWLSWSTMGCSGDITFPQQIIATKDHIDPEVDDFECQYKITAPVGKQIVLKIEMLNILPTGTDCIYKKDSQFRGMAVFMGSNNASGVAFSTVCEPVLEQNITSHTSELFILLSLEKSKFNPKANVFFNATVEFVDIPRDSPSDACGGIIDLKQGITNTITSPGFPGPYPVGAQCKWLFRAPDGYHIEYTVEEYHSPNYHEERKSSQLNFGYANYTCRWTLPYTDGLLTFYRGNTTQTSILQKICEESTESKTFEAYTSESMVAFEGAINMFGRKSGEGAREKNGFRITARPKCGGVVYATSKPQTIAMFHEGEDVCNVTIRKKDPEDSEIFIRLEEYSKINASSQHTIDDRIDIYVGGELKYTEMLKATDTTMQEYSADDEMMISVQHASAPHSAVIVYSTDDKSCGGDVRHQQGTIFAPTRSLDKPFDCGWTIQNNMGNSVKLSILDHNLRSTPNCTDSYIEIRKDNSSGVLLKRQCDVSDIDTSEYEAKRLHLFLRYRPNSEENEPDVEEPNSNRPLFKAAYKKISGGTPPSRYVANPVIEDTEFVMWTLDVGDQNAGILVTFLDIYLPEPTSYLRFTRTGENDDEEDIGYEEVTGVMPPGEKFFDTSLIRVYAKLTKDDRFRFIWDPVPLNYQNLTKTNKKTKKVYDCGGDLNPSYDWESLMNPLPAGQNYGYEENMHCRWIIRRPLFTGIELKFEYLDLENVENCAYDFVTFRLQYDNVEEEDGDIDFSSVSKHCALARSNGTYNFSVNRVLHIHFVSDRSRHGMGFKLNYRLTCNAFEHIRPGISFESYIQSPNYNNALSPREWRCQYSMIMESNRKLFVQVLDLDIEDKSPCDSSDILVVGNRYTDIYSNDRNRDSVEYCGTLGNENTTFTSARGRLFIRFHSRENNRKGFRLLIKELVTECPSGVLKLDESMPSRTIQSPEFPQRIPNSVECEYLMAAPNGHRVMLTFDPDNFDIDGSMDDCALLDYIEVRDGPSQHSQLIGRYCGNRPPSSIYSSGSFLYVKLHTTEYGRSRRFVATYEIATCGGTLIVHENVTTHVTSPNFPDPFSGPLECQWSVRSPNTHMLEAKLEHLWLLYNLNCTMERLTILDGNSTSTPLIGPTCNGRQAPETYVRSASNQLTVQFASNSSVTRGGRQYCSGKKCGFDLAVKLSETKCGGTITDAVGSLKPPGFPGRLLPHVRCVWDFKARAGFIYKFKLKFTEKKNYSNRQPSFMRPRDPCFGDLSIIEGIPPYKAAFTHMFCKDKEDEEYLTNTDLGRVIYDDSTSRDIIARFGDGGENGTFYAPFTLDYVTIPADPYTRGCTMLINSNVTHAFKPMTETKAPGIPVDSFCHLEIVKPANYGTVSIKVDNYQFNSEIEKDTTVCLSWDAHVKIQSKEPVPIDKIVCESSLRGNKSEMIYVNPNIDIMITQAFRENSGQQFNLTVEFQQCGGVITSPNSGELTSPNFGPNQKYLSNSKCRWILEAPEGQVVKIKIVEMKILYGHECESDHLIIGEGRQADVNTIHKYCHRIDGEQEQKLEERFRTIRTKGRYMSIIWKTDDKHEQAGWKLEYEFMNENDECGYHTKGMSGVIHTPKFGQEDYENNLECLWDVQVPLGYHVNLKFRDFDVETSENCEKDQLMISQEHSTRANSPNGDYYFLFQDEEKELPLCGIMHPKDFASESNRIRLNFTTDAKTTARGFRIDWEAECGTVYRLNHGVITSPGYPDGYPNKAKACTYLIAPKDENSVIALKFSDFDISSGKTSFGRSPCEEDHLQIIEASTDRVVHSFCGGNPMPQDPLVFKGPIGLKFVTDKSFMWTMEDAKNKRNRGFQLAYSVNKCGDDIELRDGTRLMTAITSPAFPLPYAKELDCVWRITTDPDRILNVRFEQLDMEDFQDCSADFVELLDSSDVSSNKTLGKFCGTMRKAPQYRVVTTGPVLLIHMKTDVNVNAGGFKLFVTSTLGEKAGCGGRLTATDKWQTLTNPKDEDGNYPPALMCGWHISGPVGSQLQIRVDAVDTERLEYPPGLKPNPECIDSLAVYDGQEFFSPVLRSDICTSKTPLPKILYTSHRHAFVTFETDRDGTGKGFNISYSTLQNECGGWLQAESQMKALIYKGITREDNKASGKERTHQRCRFMIQGTKTEPVIVNFNQFSIPSLAGDCSDSYVEIRDVGSLSECQHPMCAQKSHERKVIRMCGANKQPPFIAATNTIQMVVVSPIEVDNSTLPVIVLEYGIMDNCNRTIDLNKAPTGRLTSPNYPHQYDENTTCITKLEARGQTVMFSFQKFQLEPKRAGECRADYLMISEGESVKMEKLCGHVLPDSFLSKGQDITTTFHSDHSMTYYGYDITYYKVKHQNDHLIEFEDIVAGSGTISSVGYPHGYNASMTQIFTLKPLNSHKCRLQFVDLNIGLASTTAECEKGQANEYIEAQILHKNTAAKAKARHCSFDTWKGITMNFNVNGVDRQFNIPSTAGDCSDSYVEIRDVGSLNECQHPACAREPFQRKITKLCGTRTPTAHISNTNTIQIIVSAEIVASGNMTRPSFKFEYELLDNCNRTVNTNEIKSGRLTSPNYPRFYSENSTCVTKLESQNQKMLIAFEQFAMEDMNRVNNQCEYDYLKLSEEGSNGTAYCGSDLPSTFLTSGKDLTALFKSDHSLSHVGYDATYFTVVSQRDDRIQFADSYDMDGVLSNIGYPLGYNKSFSQVFTIRPPGNHDCSILFVDLNIGLTKNREQCLDPTDEYLEIEIFFKKQLRKARIRECSFVSVNTRELILEGDTTERYIKFTFKSDTKSENDGRGFKIRWTCHNYGKTVEILKP